MTNEQVILARKTRADMDKFLRENPNIRKALRVFNISDRQYRESLQGHIKLRNTTSTQS